MVITSTHADRKADNEAIRAARVKAGEIAREGEVTSTVYSQVDRTKTERQWAGTYQEGERLVYNFRVRSYGIAKGEAGIVIATDGSKNRLTVKLDCGKQVTYNPQKVNGVNVYHEEERTWAPGDRVIMTTADKDAHIANGDSGTIMCVDNTGSAIVKYDAVGNRLEHSEALGLGRMKHVDYGYAATSQKLQGLQFATAVVHNPRDAKAALVGASRGVQDIQVVTPDREQLMSQVQRLEKQRSATDGIRAADKEIKDARSQSQVRRGQAHSFVARYAQTLGLSGEKSIAQAMADVKLYQGTVGQEATKKQGTGQQAGL